jgi:hypothetical protein
LRQRGFDLSRVKKQTVSERQDRLLPAGWTRQPTIDGATLGF